MYQWICIRSNIEIENNKSGKYACSLFQIGVKNVTSVTIEESLNFALYQASHSQNVPISSLLPLFKKVRGGF
jgi:hypothetical protein